MELFELWIVCGHLMKYGISRCDSSGRFEFDGHFEEDHLRRLNGNEVRRRMAVIENVDEPIDGARVFLCIV